jgi:hypothetical protein
MDTIKTESSQKILSTSKTSNINIRNVSKMIQRKKDEICEPTATLPAKKYTCERFDIYREFLGKINYVNGIKV